MSEPTSDAHLQLDAPAPARAEAAASPAAQASTATLVLEPPAQVTAVAATQAVSAVPIDDAERAKLDAMVATYIDAVSTLDTHGQAFNDKVTDVSRLGDEDIKASAAVSNRLLDKPMAAMANGGLTQSSAVSRSLISLRRQVEELDPSTQGDLLSPHKLLGLLPFVPGTGSRTTSTSIAPASARSTTSSPRSTTARMSCSGTTRPSSRRSSTCGR